MRFLLGFFSFLFIVSSLNAQSLKNAKYKYLPIHGKPKQNVSAYHRVDTAEFTKLPPAVKNLLTNSAGLFVSFKTNSSFISAKWCVTEKKTSANMTAIAYKGLDLYIKKNGKWQYAGVGTPAKTCSERILVNNMDTSEKECLVYLPLYDETKELQIGVDEEANITEMPNPFKKNILIYGSSIVQGASASRPGLAYPARLSRNTGFNFVNLGLSGNGKMEFVVADMLATMPADAYVLDCIPNPSPEEIKERAAYLVNKIRSLNPDAPIIIIQTIIREQGYFDSKVGWRVKQQNEQIAKEYQELQKQGIKNLYFISGEDLLGFDHEATADGTHPNDLGFDRMLQKLQPFFLEVLKKHNIY